MSHAVGRIPGSVISYQPEAPARVDPSLAPRAGLLLQSALLDGHADTLADAKRRAARVHLDQTLQRAHVVVLVRLHEVRPAMREPVRNEGNLARPARLAVAGVVLDDGE